MDEITWKNSLHQIHCREDRCVYGCDCPCHRGGHFLSAMFAAWFLLVRASCSCGWRTRPHVTIAGAAGSVRRHAGRAGG